MKILNILVVVFTIVLFFDHNKVEGANWIQLKSGWYYDSESITYPTKNTVYVWNKLGSNNTNNNYFLYLHEIDCLERKIRIKQASYYSDGHEDEETRATNDPYWKWKYIPPESDVYNKLYKIVCPKKRK